MMRVLILIIVSFLLSHAEASAPKKLSSRDITSIQKQFEAAKDVNSEAIKVVQGKSWSCAVYGVRSRVAKEDKIVLYEFKTAGNGFENRRNPLMQNYSISKSGLSAELKTLRDHVRMGADGKLLAELSVATQPTFADTKSAIDAERSVVSYAICN